jgi:hypothetical protein
MKKNKFGSNSSSDRSDKFIGFELILSILLWKSRLLSKVPIKIWHSVTPPRLQPARHAHDISHMAGGKHEKECREKHQLHTLDHSKPCHVSTLFHCFSLHGGMVRMEEKIRHVSTKPAACFVSMKGHIKIKRDLNRILNWVMLHFNRSFVIRSCA